MWTNFDRASKVDWCWNCTCFIWPCFLLSPDNQSNFFLLLENSLSFWWCFTCLTMHLLTFASTAFWCWHDAVFGMSALLESWALFDLGLWVDDLWYLAATVPSNLGCWLVLLGDGYILVIYVDRKWFPFLCAQNLKLAFAEWTPLIIWPKIL